jgi:hypothetical protein
MFDAGWIDRLRPRLVRGSHEWIHRLAKPGFLLGQTYRRGDDAYIPRDAKWRQSEVADLDYVWHDLEVNEWMLSYAQLLGDRLEDWLGPSEARLEIATTFCPRARRHVPLTADPVQPRGVYARDLQLGGELRPLLPDASAVIAASDDYPEFEVLVEYDRTGRPAKNVEKLRRYDSLLTVGWRAVERFSGPDFEPPGRITLHPPLLVAFVCQPGTVESFMDVADAVVIGTAGLLTRPGTACYPGREAILFCDVEDMRSKSARAWLLPELPSPSRGHGGTRPRDVELPLPAFPPTADGDCILPDA